MHVVHTTPSHKSTYIAQPNGMETKDKPVYEFVWSMVDPNTVTQYLGFDDRNGVKIFEGDILESPVKHLSQKYGRRILVTDIRKSTGLALYAKDYFVIGNVYDNQELLGGTVEVL